MLDKTGCLSLKVTLEVVYLAANVPDPVHVVFVGVALVMSCAKSSQFWCVVSILHWVGLAKVDWLYILPLFWLDTLHFIENGHVIEELDGAVMGVCWPLPSGLASSPY